MEKTRRLTIAGWLDIISGSIMGIFVLFIGTVDLVLSLAFGGSYSLGPVWFVSVILPVIIIIGGINTLRRKRYSWAFSGALLACVTPIIYLIALLSLYGLWVEFNAQNIWGYLIACPVLIATAVVAARSIALSKQEFGIAVSRVPVLIRKETLISEAYCNIGEYDKAIADSNKAIELSPNNDYNYRNRGIAFMGKGEYDKAKADFEKCLEISQDLSLTQEVKGLLKKIQVFYP